jgi:exodeoxyribonuclease V alpha subunit
VIVDEMSMVDLPLFAALLRALRPGTRLVMVGDADQLPSVGAGKRVFRHDPLRTD